MAGLSSFKFSDYLVLWVGINFSFKHSWDRKGWESLQVVKNSEGKMKKEKKKTIDKVCKEKQKYGYMGRGPNESLWKKKFETFWDFRNKYGMKKINISTENL